jgi:hypothetical protein
MTRLPPLQATAQDHQTACPRSENNASSERRQPSTPLLDRLGLPPRAFLQKALPRGRGFLATCWPGTLMGAPMLILLLPAPPP